MNKRQKIIVSITGIFIVLLALVGLTYAYFLTRITGNENEKSISVTTANLELVYGDGNNLVTASNIEPGDPITPKTFTVTNNGNATVENFNIYLEDVRNSLSRKSDMVYTITCKNITEGATSTTCEDFVVLENEKNGTELVFPSVVTIIGRDTLDPATEDTEAEVHEYTITLTYKEMNVDQSEDMNKEVSAKVNIYDNKTKFLANEIMLNARKIGTFTYNKTEYIEPSLQDGETYTIPAHATTKENERILTYTMDDYGTSYYYRGNVEDNYVNYAGMCWRIVRIEGDGSVKLLLEDRYEQCNDKEGQDLNNNGTYFTGNWSDGNTYVFGYDNNRRADFINYEGGLADSFESFQTNKLTTTDIEKLKVDEWCFDHNVTSTDEYCYGEDECYTNEYYAAYTRIKTNKKPSLSCSGRKLTKFKDETDMYVGTLTADEMSFAGAANSKNYNYYLMNTYTNTYTKDYKLYWWSLSPEHFYAEGVDIAFDLYDSALSGDPVDSNYYYSRPAVTLKSGSVITEGVGTLEEPYVIG